jgi:signal transduction histidine kinase
MNVVTIYVLFAVVLVGMLALWANPRRRVNQLFFTISLHAAIWLGCIHTARSITDGFEGLRWLRFSAAVGAGIPFHLWAIKEAIISGSTRRPGYYKRLLGWVVTAAFLTYLPLTYYFVPAHSTPENPVYGMGYYVYIAGLVLAYGVLCQNTIMRIRRQTGVAKIELQIILLGGSAAALVILALMGLRPVIGGVPAYVQPVVIFVFYASTAITITTHRIFDARHLLLLLLQRGLLVAVILAVVILIWPFLTTVFSLPISLAGVVVIVLMCSAWLNNRLDIWLLRYPKAVQARLAAFDAAHSEVRTAELKSAFSKVLKGWGQTDRAFLLMEEGEQIQDNGLVLDKDDMVLRALRDVHWATPERLMRERETPERRNLAAFLAKHELGVVVHEEGPTMKLIVALGVRPSRRPFTFPEVTQLRELVSIFDSSLSRTQLLAKAQRAEQLATVGLLGAGVAHEIRNPLVSIKTFAQLLPKHYSDPAFRERFSRLITDEVARIDRLTEQLLDLAAPRSLTKSDVELHDLIRTSLDLVSARVASKNIQISTDLQAAPDMVHSDAHGLKQVILNLCFNAVQAQELKDIDKPISLRVGTRRETDKVVLTVADDGPGIPDAARLHLFEPFHSTKSNGFGLGLTVCGEILSQLDSSITLDPYEEGKGAVFRIHLPCPLRSS